MASIPREHSFDDTFALLRGGYGYISNRCHALGTDAFSTRLLLKKVTCAMGEDAAAMFYQPDRLTRKKAMPPTALLLLQDKGSVQQREGEEHRQRKQMFMNLMSDQHRRRIVDATVRCFQQRAALWERSEKVVLLEQMREIFCRGVCDWAGIPLSDSELKHRTRELSAMIDGAGAVGPRNLRGQILRHRTERWARQIIQRVRCHYVKVPEGSPLATLAWHQETDGMFMNTDVAAVELINLLRPTVAVAQFVVFGALALHQHPETRERLAQGEDEYSEWFVQEVRRFYPFFPLVGGRVRQAFDWHGKRFKEGEWILLDLYGTNHDERIWEDPYDFKPERFAAWDGSAFNFVAQGAGSFHDGHRCPGERLTIELAQAMLKRLVSDIEYAVPDQDLTVDMTKIPASPASGFIMSHIRRCRKSAAGVARGEQMVQ